MWCCLQMLLVSYSLGRAQSTAACRTMTLRWCSLLRRMWHKVGDPFSRHPPSPSPPDGVTGGWRGGCPLVSNALSRSLPLCGGAVRPAKQGQRSLRKQRAAISISWKIPEMQKITLSPSGHATQTKEGEVNDIPEN